MRKTTNKAILATVLTLSMLLAACGGATGNAPTDAPADNSAATEATQDAPAEPASEETAEAEPVVITSDKAYFEENTVTYTSDRSFTVPFAVSTYDPETLEAKEYKGVTVEPARDAIITLGEVKETKCDKDGYKAYTFNYDIEGVIKVTVDTFDYDDNYSYETQFSHVDLADYYSGNLMTYYPNLEKKEDGYDYIDKFTFNGKPYEIAYFNMESYGDPVETDWRIDESSDDSRMQWYEVTVTEKHSFEVRVPEDFDGLVLAVNLDGIKEYDTSAYYEYMGGKDRKVFEEDPKGYTYKPETSAFIKFSDL